MARLSRRDGFAYGSSPAAMEYNVARTGGVRARSAEDRDDDSPDVWLSGLALRVLAALLGRWVAGGAFGCRPALGVHTPDCPHRSNRTPYSLRQLAELVFRHTGGTQLNQVARALDELATATFRTLVEDPVSRTYRRETVHILSFRERGVEGAGGRVEGTGVVAWDPFLHESLLTGHFQYLPLELIRDLDRTSVMVWIHLLLRPATARLQMVGQYCEFSVTGARPTLPPSVLGLTGSRRDKLRASLRRAVDRGNEVQDVWLAEVMDRAEGRGLKLRVTLVRERQQRPKGAAVQDATHGTASRTVRQSRTRIEHETRRLDESGDGLSAEIRDAHPSRASSHGGREDAEALLEWGFKTVSAKQLTCLDEWAERHGGPSWAARIFRSTPRGAGQDPFRAAMEADGQRGSRTGRRSPGTCEGALTRVAALLPTVAGGMRREGSADVPRASRRP